MSVWREVFGCYLSFNLTPRINSPITTAAGFQLVAPIPTLEKKKMAEKFKTNQMHNQIIIYL